MPKIILAQSTKAYALLAILVSNVFTGTQIPLPVERKNREGSFILRMILFYLLKLYL